MIMKKIFIVFFLIPLCAFSQTNLVSWFNADFTPTINEINISSSGILKSGGVSLLNGDDGPLKQYYVSANWPKPNYNGGNSVPDLTKYLQFTVSADLSYQIILDAFKFNVRSRGSGLFQVRYSKNADFSSYLILQNEKELSNTFTTYNLKFPANTIVNSAETLYVRVYVYKTEHDLLLEHNQTGSIAPTFSGKVSLTTPIKPVANDDRTGAAKNKPVAIDVLANDDYRFSGPVTAISILNNPANGSAVSNGVTGITYTPNSNYVGYDSFYYTLTNSAGVSNTAKVEVQVIDGVEKVLVRWNKADQSPTNYTTIVTGTSLIAVGENIEINPNEVLSPGGKAFMLSNLPNPQQFDGKQDPSKYLSFSIASKNADSFAALKAFKLAYRGRGNGNLTVLASKNADFSGQVFTITNDVAYSSSWTVKDFDLPSGVYLFPEETLYIRLYAYNTNNTFLIDFIPDGESGPAVTGVSTLYSPEPCSTTVTWNGSKWSGTPTIDKKAIIAGDYNTALNGSLEACNLTVNSGKFTINADYPVKIQNEIKVNATAKMEMNSNANLIQVNDAVVNTAPITVHRISPMTKNNYTYWSSPVSGRILKDFSPLTATARFYEYVENTNLFKTVDRTTSFVPGKGYAIMAPNNYVLGTTLSFDGVFVGVPTNGTQNADNSKLQFPLVLTPNVENRGYNMIGNPYPSNINFDKLFALNSTTIYKTAYFWTNVNPNRPGSTNGTGNSYNGNAYAIYNGTGGVQATGETGSLAGATPNEFIKVGQGFIVKARPELNSLTDKNLIFNNSIRDAAGDSHFFSKGATSGKDRFWLKLTTPALNVNTILIGYIANATNGFEWDYDASLFSVGSDSFFSLLADKKLGIQGRSYPLNTQDVVSLGTKHFEAGNYTISLGDKEGIFADSQSVYLRDKQTGIITNLSQGSYVFDAEAGTTESRFEIIYQPQTTLATDGNEKEEIMVYRDGTDFVVKSATKKITELDVYDAAGRLTLQVTPNQKEVRINVAGFVNGIYVLKINQGTQITTRKIFK